jgi:hypothetical protein
VPFAFGAAARRAGMLVVVVGLLGSLLAAPVQARHQEQVELSQVQDKLDAIARVLADADQVARALVQADRDVAAGRAALAKAERRYRQPGTGVPRRCGRRCWPSWRSTPSRP